MEELILIEEEICWFMEVSAQLCQEKLNEIKDEETKKGEADE